MVGRQLLRWVSRRTGAAAAGVNFVRVNWSYGYLHVLSTALQKKRVGCIVGSGGLGNKEFDKWVMFWVRRVGQSKWLIFILF